MDLAKKIVISSLFFLTNVNAVGYQMEYSNEFRIRLKEEIIADEDLFEVNGAAEGESQSDASTQGIERRRGR